MRDLNCVQLWNENCMWERERERERLTPIYYIATFLGSLVKKFWESLSRVAIEKSSGVSFASHDLGLVGELKYSRSLQARRLRHVPADSPASCQSKFSVRTRSLDNGISSHPTELGNSSPSYLQRVNFIPAAVPLVADFQFLSLNIMWCNA